MNKRDRENDEYSTPGGINKQTGIPLAHDEEEDYDDEISDAISDTKEEPKPKKWPPMIILFSMLSSDKNKDAAALASKYIKWENSIDDLVCQWVISEEWAESMRLQMVKDKNPHETTRVSRVNKSWIKVNLHIKWEEE